MPTYRVDVDCEEPVTVQHVFELSDDLSATMHRHPRFGYPSLTLTPDHPLLARTLHGAGAHSPAVSDPPTCRCGVIDRRELVRSGDQLTAVHQYEHVRDLHHFLDHVEQDLGYTIRTVELHQLPEPEPRRAWRTN